MTFLLPDSLSHLMVTLFKRYWSIPFVWVIVPAPLWIWLILDAMI